MITIFNGRQLGVGTSKASAWVQVQRELVSHLHLFTPSGWMVFMAIVLHIDNDNYCWPSINRLCECTGLSEATVRSAIRHLCGMSIDGHQILSVTSRASSNGRTSSNGYRIFPCEDDKPVECVITAKAVEKKEVTKEDDPAFPLMQAFMFERWGPFSSQNITDKDWKNNRLIIWQMHKAGVKPSDVMEKVQTLKRKWQLEMITVRSLWKHWDTYASSTYGKVTKTAKIEDWFNDND